jgi:hypothetical protein
MFSRASVSISRSVRIAQILNLYRLDMTDSRWHGPLPTIPPPKDWCELEERRRTFWAIFCFDRLGSSVTGWPTLINSQDVNTDLFFSYDRDCLLTQARLRLTFLPRKKRSSKASRKRQPLLLILCALGHYSTPPLVETS